jgi:hypothetical protein
VTDAEFNTSTDPEAMLSFLTGRGNASQRKLRLFAVACCRAAWRLFTSQAVRRAVEVSELYADGLATVVELRDARLAAERLAERGFQRKVRAMPWAMLVQTKFARQTAVQVASVDIDDVLDGVASRLVVAKTRAGYERSQARQRLHQAALLRCLFGPLPFREVKVDPAWRTPTVVALAIAIYDGHRFGDLPILADALEEVGTDAEILRHLRQKESGHVLGCWCLDLLLGKE